MKRVLVLLLAGVLLFALVPVSLSAQAQEEKETFRTDNYEYSLENGQATIVHGWADGDTIVYPAILDGYPVVAVGEHAGYGSTYYHMVISEGIERVDNKAFIESRELRSVVLPESLKSIGSGAFFRCESLEEITIPSGVNYVGPGAFEGCKTIKAIQINEGNATYSSDNGILIETANQVLHTYPAGIAKASFQVPAGIAEIGGMAFSGCEALKEVKFPSSLTAIGEGAFRDCISLTNFELPGGVTEIAPNTFENCKSLSKVSLHKNTVSIGAKAFANCETLRDFEIPGSVGFVGEGAFMRTNFSKFTVGKGNTALFVDKGVLYNADKTVLIAYPTNSKTKNYAVLDTALTIGAGAFYLSINLEDIKLPDGLTTINASAFAGTTCSINLPDTVEQIGESAFAYSEFSFLLSPANLRSIGDYAFQFTKLVEVMLPEGLETMGDDTFLFCSYLSTVTLPGTLKEIPEGAFNHCTALSEIQFGHGIERIGPGAFYAAGIQEVNLPDTLKYIDERAFKDSLLSTLVLPDSADVAPYAFDGCEELREITLSKSMRRIPDSLFQGCVSLRKVIIPEGPEEMGNFVFSGCSDVTVYIPDSLSFIEYYSLNNLEPGTLTFVGSENSPVKEYIENSGMIFRYGSLKEDLASLGDVETPKDNGMQATGDVYDKYAKMADNIYTASNNHKWSKNDSWTREQQESFWAALAANWKADVQSIVDIVNTRYASYGPDTMGFTAEEITASEGLKTAFGMALWGFGEVANKVLTTAPSGKTFDLAQGQYPTLDDYYTEVVAKYGDAISYVAAGESPNGVDVFQVTKDAFASEWAAKDNSMNKQSVSNIKGTDKAPEQFAEESYQELRVGSSGQEVLDMKKRFYELGYFRTDKFNDSFTINTEDTVKLFEKNNGLPVDGIADAQMLGVLFSDKAVGK